MLFKLTHTNGIITMYSKKENNMAKAGMRRPDPRAPHGTEENPGIKIPKNKVEPVPEIQGKAKTSNKKVANLLKK